MKACFYYSLGNFTFLFGSLILRNIWIHNPNINKDFLQSTKEEKTVNAHSWEKNPTIVG